MYTQVRWQQRFQNFEKTYRLLSNISSIKNRSEAEKMWLIQAFEICFELSWKLMKDYLELKWYNIKWPRDIIKQSLQDGIISKWHLWLDALEKRNQTVHIYDEKIAELIEEEIDENYLWLFKSLYEFFKKEIDE